MTMINRVEPEAKPTLALTETEMHLLDLVVRSQPESAGTLATYLVKLARLGGYLARKRSTSRQYRHLARLIPTS